MWRRKYDAASPQEPAVRIHVIPDISAVRLFLRSASRFSLSVCRYSTPKQTNTTHNNARQIITASIMRLAVSTGTAPKWLMVLQLGIAELEKRFPVATIMRKRYFPLNSSWRSCSCE